ncbi:hypothetical protein HPP92_020181 [Vanilla planifolia]|uniref:Nuclease associated modular domain-containing protein n=1 Tax=Vanilla planifolia TaxID=51239 RepID=A0A835QA82_VANPL|nr:hypothetical protein HPP92_020181 [Vanilla planifolia]
MIGCRRKTCGGESKRGREMDVNSGLRRRTGRRVRVALLGAVVTLGEGNTVAVCNRELERRRKIGVANRGRTPWNKGRTHSKETIELIKKRTIEALKGPKGLIFLSQVRKKMSERSHSHSEQSKSSISLALKRFWLERLKHKQSMEKVYLSWIHVIKQRRSSVESHPVVEKLDLEVIKMKKLQRRVSLSDQLKLNS